MTPGSDERPVRRVLVSPVTGEEYVVELRRTLILIRPKGTRRGGGQEVAVLPGSVHVRAIDARIMEERKAKKKAPGRFKVTRGHRIPGK